MSAILEILQKFCATEHFREALKTPFSRGEYTYATNGFVLVRVPRIAEVAENSEAPNTDSPNVAVYFSETEGSWADMPDLVVEMMRVPILDKKCPECDGAGTVELENDFNEYEAECRTCDGKGWIGDGRTKEVPKEHFIRFMERTYQTAGLLLIQSLPGVQVRGLEGRECRHLQFRFDGGDGVVLGRRE